MTTTNEWPPLGPMAKDTLKKLCETDYKRFYGLRTDLRELNNGVNTLILLMQNTNCSPRYKGDIHDYLRIYSRTTFS